MRAALFASDRGWFDRVADVARRLGQRRRARSFKPVGFVRAPCSHVSLLSACDYSTDFRRLIVDALTPSTLTIADRSVLLKPNLVEYESGSVINTHPAVIAGAADAFLSLGAREVIVAEGPGHRRDVEYLLDVTGVGHVVSGKRLRFVDLNHDDVAAVPLRTRFSGWKRVWLPATLLNADVVVSMPKLKTHHWAGMTAGMKNLFGAVPGAVYGWPKNPLHLSGIPQWIVDLTATIQPHLTIVDAVVAMEGDGPIMGSPRPLGLIAVGTDPVAVDATCARVIGLDPMKVPYLAMAGAFLGHIDSARIVQRGEPECRFATRFELLDAFEHMRLHSARC